MSALDDVRSLLAQVTTPGSFAARRTAAPGDLRLDVKGVGRIRLPVTATHARDRCAAGRPARHGRKDQTRIDRRVRDTWEIPKNRIYWARAAQQETGRGLLDRTLTVAAGLDASELAAMLRQPFTLSQMTARSGPRLVALLDGYGIEWCRILLAHWASDRRHEPTDARAAWLASTLPDLCRTLFADDSSPSAALAREIVGSQWAWMVHQRKDIARRHVRRLDSSTARAAET